MNKISLKLSLSNQGKILQIQQQVSYLCCIRFDICKCRQAVLHSSILPTKSEDFIRTGSPSNFGFLPIVLVSPFSTLNVHFSENLLDFHTLNFLYIVEVFLFLFGKNNIKLFTKKSSNYYSLNLAEGIISKTIAKCSLKTNCLHM